MGLSVNKAEKQRMYALELCIGTFYSVLIQFCKEEVEDIDLALQELIELGVSEDGKWDQPDEDIEHACQRILKENIRNCLRAYNVRLTAHAQNELKVKSEAREGLTPSYTEVDL